MSASTQSTLFSRETKVSISIKAKRSIVWNILTNAADYVRWNSTIVYLKGEIKQGQKLTLKSNVNLEREFKLNVDELKPEEKMVWADGTAPFFRGVRTFTLTETAEGCEFFMSERFAGIMAPMILRFIPDLDESFNQFAADLKKEAEIIHKADALLNSLTK